MAASTPGRAEYYAIAEELSAPDMAGPWRTASGADAAKNVQAVYRSG